MLIRALAARPENELFLDFIKGTLTDESNRRIGNSETADNAAKEFKSTGNMWTMTIRKKTNTAHTAEWKIISTKTVDI